MVDKMKIGLVLEGGAMRGMFTAGVLDIFMAEGISVDGIVSVSAGALFGVNFPARQAGRAIRYNQRFLRDKRYISLQSWLKTGNIVNKDFAFYQVPFSLDPFDNQAFKQSSVDFYVTVTNVKTGQAEYLKIEDVFAQMEALRATSAMPYMSELIEYQSKKYLDGSIADGIPFLQAQALGYDKLIVVLTRPIEYRKAPSRSWLSRLVYRHYPRLLATMANRYRYYNQQVEEIIRRHQAGELFVIRPSQTLPIKRLERNPQKIQAMYDLGVSDARQALEPLKRYLAGE